MSDGRVNNGGVRKGQGRKPKAEEEKVSSYAIKAMIKIFGSEEQGFEELAKQAKKGSFNHHRLLMEYAYGKLKEEIEDKVIVINWEETLTK